jgi:threonine/homoserine/homoserine lactone efflux protein
MARHPDHPACPLGGARGGGRSGPWNAFWQGIVVEALNPKTAAFFLAFLPQFVDPAGDVALQFAILGFISVALNTAADVGVTFLASAVCGGLDRRPRLIRRIREASGLAIVSLGLALAVARRPA